MPHGCFTRYHRTVGDFLSTTEYCDSTAVQSLGVPTRGRSWGEAPPSAILGSMGGPERRLPRRDARGQPMGAGVGVLALLIIPGICDVHTTKYSALICPNSTCFFFFEALDFFSLLAVTYVSM